MSRRTGNDGIGKDLVTRRTMLRGTGGAALVAASGLSLFGGTAAAADTTVRLGHAMPPEHPQSRSMEKFAELCKQYSGGKVDITIYGSAQLGGDDKMLLSTQAGTQEIYYGGVEPLSGRIKPLQVLSFPFVFANMEQVDSVYHGVIGNKIFDMMKPLNLVGLGWGEVGFRQLSNSRRQVKSAKDMEGLKIRVVQNAFALKMWKAMGVNATPMSFAEVFTALETGALDGQENPLIHMYSNKMYEVQKYITITNHVYTPAAMLVSDKYWGSLGDSERAAMRKAAKEAMLFHRKVMTQADTDVRNKLQEAGMTISVMPPDELSLLRTKVQPVVDEFVPVVGAEFTKEFYAEVDKARLAAK